jgi:predicted aspartyl protease
MVRKLLCMAWALLLWAFLGAAALTGQQVRVSQERSALPFELRSGFLVVVTGEIGNLKGLKFILDTGASYTVIDRSLGERLHLARYSKKVTNFDRQVSVEGVDLSGLRIGPLQADAFPVLVAKLSDYSDFAEGVDGIIGLDLLARSERLFIDYENRQIAWEFANGPVNVASRPTCLLVPFTVQGARFRLALDTGLQGILLYKDRVRQGLPELRLPGKEALRVSFGRVQTTELHLPGARLAGAENVATVFLMDRPMGGDPPGVDGYLGIATLNAKRVEFDFVTNTFRWQ